MATATLKPVNGSRRNTFLPKLVGPAFIQFEGYVYSWMARLSRDYDGGFWNFYTVDKEPCFIAPDTDQTFHIQWSDNYFDERVSAEAAGIIACIFALGTLFNQYPHLDILMERRDRLIDYAQTHPEASLILRAID